MDRREFIKKTGEAAAAILVATALPAQVIKTIHNKEEKKMKIVILTGSPRLKGNTNYLAERFSAGAKEKGHEVYIFDCAHHDIHGCTGCNSCGMDGDCIFKDDFLTVRPKLLEADMVVLCTPMYYFGFSSQLKCAIDRFYAMNTRLRGKKTTLLMAYADTSAKEAQPLLSHYHALTDYLGWKSVGEVVAPGIWTAGSIRVTRYGDDAYRLGKSL
jgi:multimeric flavodoxin WrbA